MTQKAMAMTSRSPLRCVRRATSWRNLACGRDMIESMLSPGTTAPAFTLIDQHDQSVSLSQFVGQWVLLWWYPKAATPG
jgi:cytochrome oxidase Cu insertion factor (SCO1/SenC/PrrC family)